MTEKYRKALGFVQNNKGDAFDLSEIVDLLNKQDKEIKQLKDELFDVTKNWIYETSSDSEKDIEEARKDIYGDE